MYKMRFNTGSFPFILFDVFYLKSCWECNGSISRVIFFFIYCSAILSATVTACAINNVTLSKQVCVCIFLLCTRLKVVLQVWAWAAEWGKHAAEMRRSTVGWCERVSLLSHAETTGGWRWMKERKSGRLVWTLEPVSKWITACADGLQNKRTNHEKWINRSNSWEKTPPPNSPRLDRVQCKIDQINRIDFSNGVQPKTGG